VRGPKEPQERGKGFVVWYHEADNIPSVGINQRHPAQIIALRNNFSRSDWQNRCQIAAHNVAHQNNDGGCFDLRRDIDTCLRQMLGDNTAVLHIRRQQAQRHPPRSPHLTGPVSRGCPALATKTYRSAYNGTVVTRPSGSLLRYLSPASISALSSMDRICAAIRCKALVCVQRWPNTLAFTQLTSIYHPDRRITTYGQSNTPA
jgi:hypothetical protein